MTTAIVFLFLALSAMQASGDGDPTLVDVVSAHEAALGSIHKIELTMRHDNRYFASGKPLLEPDSWTGHWAKDGLTQRMRFRTEPAVRSDGLPDGIYDLLADDREVRMLQNWDPDAPQKITPLNQGSLSAQISPRDRGSPFVVNPEKHLLWRFDFDVVGESWSLGDLVRESGDLGDRPQGQRGFVPRRARFPIPRRRLGDLLAAALADPSAGRLVGARQPAAEGNHEHARHSRLRGGPEVVGLGRDSSTRRSRIRVGPC